MKVLFVGDIVGSPGRKALRESVGSIVSERDVDFVIANGENAAGGFGIIESVAAQLFACGVHVITSGNHIWDKKEVYGFIDHEQRLLRPANYPNGAPGHGYGIFETPGGGRISVLNVAGRVFMPSMDCPFHYARNWAEKMAKETKVCLIDFHAEATSEKIAFARMMDGQVSAVVGTHTHVQTADEQILPNGTAYITDVGMTGPKDSVIGTEPDIVIERFLTQVPKRLEVAKGPWKLDAVLIDIDESTGRANAIERVNRSS